MNREDLVNKFTKKLIKEYDRKNAVYVKDISCALITAGLGRSFLNDACKSSGKVSKSQIIYRKIENKELKELQDSFRNQMGKFLRLLKIFNRNRKFLISFDETYDEFFGNKSLVDQPLYIHAGNGKERPKQYYEYLTVAITSNRFNFILDGIITYRGYIVEDYIKEMVEFIKQHLEIDAVLFDRGFGWGPIKVLQELNVNYLIFWKKQGSWYKKYFKKMEDGEFVIIEKSYKYNRDMTNYKLTSQFVLIKQLKYGDKKFDWIFATNLKKDKAESYVKRYKRRWGIETIFRITDNIRIYTTSTKIINRYFLFLSTCLIYNIWKFFQMIIGNNFTYLNFKMVFLFYMVEKDILKPPNYNKFSEIVEKYLPIR